MDSGVAALLGALVGSATSIATTWLGDYLRRKPAKKLAQRRKERLLQLLSGEKYTWRSLGMLCDAIGADEETTIALLLEIDARGSMTGGKPAWALVSRAAFPDDIPPSAASGSH